MTNWLDKLPTSERQRIRNKYKISASAYEKLRQSVKGPEEMKQEMQYNEKIAQLQFTLETEPAVRNALKNQIEKDIAEKGIEAVFLSSEIPPDTKQALLAGNFEVVIETNKNDVDTIAIAPEGVVAESIPVSKHLTDSYLSQL